MAGAITDAAATVSADAGEGAEMDAGAEAEAAAGAGVGAAAGAFFSSLSSSMGSRRVAALRTLLARPRENAA